MIGLGKWVAPPPSLPFLPVPFPHLGRRSGPVLLPLLGRFGRFLGRLDALFGRLGALSGSSCLASSLFYVRFSMGLGRYLPLGAFSLLGLCWGPSEALFGCLGVLFGRLGALFGRQRSLFWMPLLSGFEISGEAVLGCLGAEVGLQGRFLTFLGGLWEALGNTLATSWAPPGLS